MYIALQQNPIPSIDPDTVAISFIEISDKATFYIIVGGAQHFNKLSDKIFKQIKFDNAIALYCLQSCNN
jgi:hypothetical protein